MQIAAHRFVLQRNETLTDKHMSHADPEEQSILIHSTAAEGG
jgi:hypothetical protein